MFKHEHMVSGVKKALASPNTPSHLKVHLQKRLDNMAQMSVEKVVTKKSMPFDGMGGSPLAVPAPKGKKFAAGANPVKGAAPMKSKAAIGSKGYKLPKAPAQPFYGE